MRKISPLATIAAVTLLVFSGAIRAETLDSTFQATLSANPQLRSAAYDVAGAQARVAQAKASFMPTVTATGGYGFNRYDAPGFASISTQHPWSGGASLSMPLYTGGRLSAQLAQARAQGRASEYQQSVTAQSVLFSAGNAFLKVARAEKALDLARAQESLLARELNQARAELKAGLRTKTDVSQAQARFAGAQALVQSSTASLNTARFEFASIVGRDPSGPLEMPDLAEPAERGTFMARVRDDSPQALATRAAVEAASAGVESAKAAYRPTLSLQMGYSHDENQNPMLRAESNRTVSMQLVIPLYTGGMARAVRDEASAKLSAAKSDADYVDSTLHSEAASAWETLDSDNAQIEAREQQVAAALTAVEGAHKELKAGTRTLLDVLNAEQEALDAQIELLNATFDRTSAILRLQALVGGLGA